MTFFAACTWGTHTNLERFIDGQKVEMIKKYCGTSLGLNLISRKPIDVGQNPKHGSKHCLRN